MDRVFSPKRLQQEGKTKEAFVYYKKRYHDALQEGDSFLSSLYLDEIAQTLIIGNERLSFDGLREELSRVAMMESLDEKAREQAKLDLQTTLRKRFPEKFEETFSSENE